MEITWLGHSGFRIEIDGQVLLIDPWLTGNPMFPEARKQEAVAGATHVLVSHGHFDHVADVLEVAKAADLPVLGPYELISHWEKTEGITAMGFNRGGTVMAGDVAVSMVPASHSSSLATDHGPMYAGSEVGFMIQGAEHCIYFSGDTDIMADMDWMAEYYRPDIGILSAGGHFTMDMRGATFAAKKYFDFKTVIPCHYRTFPLLEQSAQEMIDGLPGVNVIEPQVLEAITL